MKPHLTVAQQLEEKPAYAMDDLVRIGESRATIYRVLRELRESGFAQQIREGCFTVRSSLFQPYNVWKMLQPSLQSLKQGRLFGRSYNESDVKLANDILDGMVTLDYRAYELTKFQTPYLFGIYVDDLDQTARILKEHKFSEGTSGRVLILPRIGSFENKIQRVYQDCIAYGGRSLLDAIAVEILYGAELDPHHRGAFKIGDVLKVREELASQSVHRSR